MAAISIGPAVGAGFQLIARRPVTVLAWGALRVAAIAASFGLIGPVWASMMTEVAQQAQAGVALPPAAAARIMSHMMVAQGVGGLVQILQLALGSVISCAVARAILHPERTAWAYLRLGAPEFFTGVLLIAAGFVLAFGIIAFAIPIAIACAILVAAAHATAGAVAVALLGILVLLAAILYGALRFALLVPMLVDDGQFHLFDAWTLTSCRAASLLAIALCLLGIGLLAEIIVVAGGVALVAATVGFAELSGALRHPGDMHVPGLWPAIVVAAALAVPVFGCAEAVFVAPWARAYRDLSPGAGSPNAPLPATPPGAPTPVTA